VRRALKMTARSMVNAPSGFVARKHNYKRRAGRGQFCGSPSAASCSWHRALPTGYGRCSFQKRPERSFTETNIRLKPYEDRRRGSRHERMVLAANFVSGFALHEARETGVTAGLRLLFACGRLC
jgi:hypothetical protein